jgi:tRNA(Ile)-lysidine synthase
VLVGYSGGADSLGLLAMLIDLARLEGFDVRALHVDHGVRQTSAADAVKVGYAAKELGVPIDVRRIPDGSVDRHQGVGHEEAMRRERYRVFAEVAADWRADAIALAHHQRDQAETVLLHLLRGAGLRGASGMKPITTMRVPWWDEVGLDIPRQDLVVWRPLLGESAPEIRFHAESLGVPIVEDSSNVDTSFRRNAIRHDVLPLLERVAPGATINLSRFAALAADDSDELDNRAHTALDRFDDPNVLNRESLVALSRAIQRRVIQFWIARQSPSGLEIPLNRIDEVLRIAGEKGRSRVVEIGMGVSVLVTRDELVVTVTGTSL